MPSFLGYPPPLLTLRAEETGVSNGSCASLSRVLYRLTEANEEFRIALARLGDPSTLGDEALIEATREARAAGLLTDADLANFASARRLAAVLDDTSLLASATATVFRQRGYATYSDSSLMLRAFGERTLTPDQAAQLVADVRAELLRIIPRGELGNLRYAERIRRQFGLSAEQFQALRRISLEAETEEGRVRLEASILWLFVTENPSLRSAILADQNGVARLWRYLNLPIELRRSLVPVGLRRLQTAAPARIAGEREPNSLFNDIMARPRADETQIRAIQDAVGPLIERTGVAYSPELLSVLVRRLPETKEGWGLKNRQPQWLVDLNRRFESTVISRSTGESTELFDNGSIRYLFSALTNMRVDSDLEIASLQAIETEFIARIRQSHNYGTRFTAEERALIERYAHELFEDARRSAESRLRPASTAAAPPVRARVATEAEPDGEEVETEAVATRRRRAVEPPRP